MGIDEQNFGTDAPANTATNHYLLHDNNGYGVLSTSLDRDWYTIFADIGASYVFTLGQSSPYTFDSSVTAFFNIRNRFGNIVLTSTGTAPGFEQASGTATDTLYFLEVVAFDAGGYTIRSANTSAADDVVNPVPFVGGVTQTGTLTYTADGDGHFCRPQRWATVFRGGREP